MKLQQSCNKAATEAATKAVKAVKAAKAVSSISQKLQAKLQAASPLVGLTLQPYVGWNTTTGHFWEGVCKSFSTFLNSI